MALNIRIDTPETPQQASATEAFCITVVNDDALACLFKVGTKHPLRYLIANGSGVVQPRTSMRIAVKLRTPPQLGSEDLAREGAMAWGGALPAPILRKDGAEKAKGGVDVYETLSARSGATDTPGAVAGQVLPDGSVASSDILKVEVRVVMGVLTQGAGSTDADYKRLWESEFTHRHSTHMVPVALLFLSAKAYGKSLWERQEKDIAELEGEKQALQQRIVQLEATKQQYTKQNTQFAKDIQLLEKRVAKNQGKRRGGTAGGSGKIMVPWWIGLVAMFTSFFSAAALATAAPA